MLDDRKKPVETGIGSTHLEGQFRSWGAVWSSKCIFNLPVLMSSTFLFSFFHSGFPLPKSFSFDFVFLDFFIEQIVLESQCE